MRSSERFWGGVGLTLTIILAVLIQLAAVFGLKSLLPSDLLTGSLLILVNLCAAAWITMAAYTAVQGFSAAAFGMSVYSVVFSPLKWSRLGTPRLSWVGNAAKIYGGSGYLIFGARNPSRVQLFATMTSGPALVLAVLLSSAVSFILTMDVAFTLAWFWVSAALLGASLIPYKSRGQLSPGAYVWRSVQNPAPMLANLKCVWASAQLVQQGRPRDYDPSFLDEILQDPDLKPYALYMRYSRCMDMGLIQEAGALCSELILTLTLSDLPSKPQMLWDAASYFWRYGSDRDQAVWAASQAQKSGPPPQTSVWRIVQARVKGEAEEAAKQTEAMKHDLTRLADSQARRDHLEALMSRLLDPAIPMPLAGTGFFPLEL